MNITFRLARKVETNEWVVKAYINGVYNEDMTYYTDNKEDAINTKLAMEKHEIIRQGREQSENKNAR